jgi:TolB-like protein/Flp pilus assembly protein TadD
MNARRFEFGPFEFDADRGVLLRERRSIAINARCASLLTELLAADGQPVAKSALMDAAWPGLAVEESNLTVQIAALRRHMSAAGDDVEWIGTVPRVGYRFAGPLIRQGKDQGTHLRSSSKVLVLPFEILGDDAGRQYLADGITDDVIMALAQFPWLSVASRGTSFARRNQPRDPKTLAGDLGIHFLVDGTIRKGPSGTRISVHLNDAEAGRAIWSEHFDLADAEMFAVQDAIAERIAGAIEPELLLLNGLHTTPHTGNPTAWDVVRQGTFNFHKVTQSSHVLARDLFRRAAEIDPELPEAHIWLARVDAGLIAYNWSQDADECAREGLDAALRAIHLDPRNPYSHYALAITSAYTGRLEQSILAAERATELGPSFALGHLVLGMARLYHGDARGAVEPLRHGLHLNPHDPQNAVWFNLLMLALFFSGDGEGAAAMGRTALKARPDWRPLLRTLACCHAALGHWPEAHRVACDLSNAPDAVSDALAPFRENQPDWDAELDRLLQVAQQQGDVR